MSTKLLGIVLLVLLAWAGIHEVQQHVVVPARVAVHHFDAQLACASSGSDNCGLR